VLFLGYELGEQDSKGENFFMTQILTLSLDLRSTLFAIVKQLHGELKLGDKFSPAMLAGKPCLLQISHETKINRNNERTYANIESVGRVPKGTITPSGSCAIWRIGDRAKTPLPDLSVLPPVWHEATGKMLTIREWVEQSHECQGQPVAATGSPDSNSPAVATPSVSNDVDDIPF
jgi:hypothetical protein